MHIYKTTNLLNGKIYIGLTTIADYDDYYGSGSNIQMALKKYGKDNFSREIIEECDNLEDLRKAEIKWIKHYNSTKKSIGYNISPGGDLNPQCQHKGLWKYDTDGTLLATYDSISNAVNEIKDKNIYRKSERNKRPIKGHWYSICPLTKDEVLDMHARYEAKRSKAFVDAAAKRYADPNYRQGRVEWMRKLGQRN